MESTRITVTLDEDQYLAFTEMAEDTGQSLSDLVRQAVSAYLHDAVWSRKGIGDLAMDQIRAGRTNEEALAAVREAFPNARTSPASIAWYRSKLRKDGEEILSDLAVRKAREAEARLAKDERVRRKA